MNDLESNERGAGDVQGGSEERELDIVTSPLAVYSCIFGVAALVLSVAGVLSLPSGCSHIALILGAGAVGSAWMALFLGIVSLCQIGKSGGRLTGKGYAVIGTVIPLGLLCLVLYASSLAKVRGPHPRLRCTSNLSGIGKAMLIYANDYKGKLPRAGGPASTWGPTSDFQAATAAEAYGLDDGDGQASISANFFLLVKYVDVTPKPFLCPHDEKATVFYPDKYDAGNKSLVDLWDFGPDPSRHCSYSYHMPYGEYSLTSASDPDLAVAADRNPWLPSRGAKARDFKSFDPDGDREAVKAGNTPFHNWDGQSVLYVDGHTTFEKSSACGLNGDNIYTPQKGLDIRKGVVPTVRSQPSNRTDSLLLHDPPLEAAETKRRNLIFPGVTVTIAAVTAITLVLLKTRRKERQE